jgi:tripartite-type tricarboxylate transporter receptor subunit TctC
MKRWSGLLGVCLLSGAIAGQTDARAQDRPAGYPSRPIRIIVPSAPGGALDMICRTLAQMLSEKWGQTVVVDNRPGGGTVIATEIGARAPADGYNLSIPAW